MSKNTKAPVTSNVHAKRFAAAELGATGMRAKSALYAVLAKSDGVSQKELADIAGVTEGTVSKRILAGNAILVVRPGAKPGDKWDDVDRLIVAVANGDVRGTTSKALREAVKSGSADGVRAALKPSKDTTRPRGDKGGRGAKPNKDEGQNVIPMDASSLDGLFTIIRSALTKAQGKATAKDADRFMALANEAREIAEQLSGVSV